MKYEQFDKNQGHDQPQEVLDFSNEPTSSTIMQIPATGVLKNTKSRLSISSKGKRKLKLLMMFLTLLMGFGVFISIIIHFKNKYYGTDKSYEGFRKFYEDMGKTMTDALPNGTFVLHPFKPSPFDKEYGLDYSLKDLCRNTKWHKDMYFSCSSIGDWGGLWNDHNEAIGCFRRAIDAGLGIVIPSIIPRRKNFLEGWDLGNPLPFEHLYDTEHLKKSLAEHCPQLSVKDYTYEFKNTMRVPVTDAQLNFGEFKEHFENWLKDTDFDLNNHPETVFAHNPGTAYWNFRDNGITIHKQFYDLVRLSHKSDNVTALISAKLPERFIGFHLRQELDWNRASFEGLTGWFLKLINEHFSDIKTVYVATGMGEAENKFREFMKPLGFTVISKWSLVADNPTATAYMQDLRFDELAIIEHQLLLKSTQFYGVTASTLSWVTSLVRGDFDMSKCKCELYEGNIADIELGY